MSVQQIRRLLRSFGHIQGEWTEIRTKLTIFIQSAGHVRTIFWDDQYFQDDDDGFHETWEKLLRNRFNPENY